jgi:hypothetical protein
LGAAIPVSFSKRDPELCSVYSIAVSRCPLGNICAEHYWERARVRGRTRLGKTLTPARSLARERENKEDFHVQYILIEKYCQSLYYFFTSFIKTAYYSDLFQVI